MKTTVHTRTCLIAITAALALVTLPLVQANPELQPMADAKAPLPVSTSFEKGTPGENSGPYAMKVTNTSDKELKLGATVLYSVQSHNRAKEKKLGTHELKPGASWTIDDLAAQDKVTLHAHGYEKLEVTVPPGQK